jgi:hypothetical protein
MQQYMFVEKVSEILPYLTMLQLHTAYVQQCAVYGHQTPVGSPAAAIRKAEFAICTAAAQSPDAKREANMTTSGPHRFMRCDFPRRLAAYMGPLTRAGYLHGACSRLMLARSCYRCLWRVDAPQVD